MQNMFNFMDDIFSVNSFTLSRMPTVRAEFCVYFAITDYTVHLAFYDIGCLFLGSAKITILFYDRLNFELNYTVFKDIVKYDLLFKVSIID